MTAYVIGEIEVTDPERYADYVAQGRPVIERFGGRVLAAGGALEAFEGAPRGGRVVILEFPSLDHARRWYRSDAYAPAKAIRLKAAKAVLFAVEGLDRQPASRPGSP